MSLSADNPRDANATPPAWLEVLVAGRPPRRVAIDGTRFEIGRGVGGSHRLVLDDNRVSRQAALILSDGGQYRILDAGQRKGLLLNGAHLDERTHLEDGDVISFANTDDVRIIFRLDSESQSLNRLLSRLDESSRKDDSDANLQQLSLLLEATALLSSGMPMEQLLAAMVDQAIAITAAERGSLLEADEAGRLEMLLARGAGGVSVDAGAWIPSQTAIDHALSEGQAFIELDLDQAGDAVRTAASVVGQRLRSIIAIPLYSRIRATEGESRGPLLGCLYLDSRQPSAFRGLGRRVLDALALEAAAVIDNARMVARERERRQMEQDLAIARGIQQRLLPKQFRRYRAFEIQGANLPCYSVGGDYFDVVEPEPGRIAFVVADVTGKGLPAALLTAMLQGGFAGITLTPDLARLVTHVNRYVWGRSEANRFATAFVGLLGGDGTLDYINAGHLPGLLVRNSGETQRLESGSFPIGVFPDTGFTASRIRLEPGELLAVFTDGLTEAANPAHEEFGMNRLIATLRKHKDTPVTGLPEAVLAEVATFTGGAAPDDDLTLLVVRYTGEH
jgi:phosphoserine phosphatase RsbU/P